MTSIIKQEISRIRLTSSTEESFLINLSSYKTRLLQRGYKLRYLNQLFIDIPTRNSVINKLKSYKHKSNTSTIKSVRPLLITKLPCLKTRINLSHIFKLPDLIVKNPIFQRAYNNPKIMVVNKNFANLGMKLKKNHPQINSLDLLGGKIHKWIF